MSFLVAVATQGERCGPTQQSKDKADLLVLLLPLSLLLLAELRTVDVCHTLFILAMVQTESSVLRIAHYQADGTVQYGTGTVLFHFM